MRTCKQRHSWQRWIYSLCVFLSVSTSLLYTGPASAVTLPSGNRECAICHIMWLDDFKRDDVAPLIAFEPKPVEKTGKQDVSSTERMCFSCHDGFVLDSRFMWENNRHNHPVGVKPTSNVQIPTAKGKTVFPMNEDGKMYCGTCHTAHGVDWKEEDSPIFLRIGNKNSNMCMACHLNRSTGPDHGNHPIGKKLKNPPQALLAQGSMFSKQKEIICQSCHVVHAAKEKKILAIANSDSQLCSTCHKKQQVVRKTKHNMAVMEPALRNVRDQKVSVVGPCSACHIPHKAKGPHLWARKLQAGTDLSTALCQSCHNPDGPAHKKTVGKYSHPVDAPVRKAGIIAKSGGWLSTTKSRVPGKAVQQLPLFDKQGRRKREGGNVTCLTCHDPHRWSASHGKKTAANIRKQEGDASSSFLRLSNANDSALCKNCHRDKAAVSLSKHNLDISAADEKNVKNKTVAKSGVCSACHLPHNGKGPRMWARKREHQDSAITSMCTSCHRKDGLAKDKTTGLHSHPIHIGLSKLDTTTTLPTFQKNGNKDDRDGLVDCATCHDPHQWDPDNINSLAGKDKQAEGDAGNSFLRKHADGDAALCTDCHEKQASVVKTDHDMRVVAADGHNAKEQTVAQSGVCGQCHAVHNANQSFRLWIQDNGHGDEAMAILCTSCHRQGGIANQKVPVELKHPPRNIPVNKGRIRSGARRSVQPKVYSKTGEHAAVGMITCATCHDPHKWDTASVKQGKGKNLEGDVRNSFLRHKATQNFLCADCHGEDSLYRYKYFHWKKSRPEEANAGP